MLAGLAAEAFGAEQPKSRQKDGVRDVSLERSPDLRQEHRGSTRSTRSSQRP